MDIFSHFFDVIGTYNGFIALLTLTVLEIILGIDNIVFLSIIVGRAPKSQQKRVRMIGLLMAMGLRILMLFGISLIIQSDKTLFSIASNEISIRDLILFGGGLFLIGKSTMEIHHKIAEAGLIKDEEPEPLSKTKVAKNAMGSLFLQIGIINIIFSIDSLLTAIGLTQDVPTMILGIVISTLAMMAIAGRVGEFIINNPTVIMLALSFLIMIGTLLVAESLDVHVPRQYVYFAMGFSLFVELLNVMLIRRLFGKKK
jgi:predicted tellurium resistance membrane protein TerC